MSSRRMLAWARKNRMDFARFERYEADELTFATLGYDIQKEIGRDEYCRRLKINRKEYDDERAGID